MQKCTLLFFFFIVFFILGAEAQSSEAKIPKSADNLVNPFAGDESVIRKGYKIYNKVCWVCHGDAGKGDGPSVPTLNTKPANVSDPEIIALSDGALFWWISNGGNDMQPFKGVLSEEEIWMVVNFLRKLQEK